MSETKIDWVVETVGPNQPYRSLPELTEQKAREKMKIMKYNSMWIEFRLVKLTHTTVTTEEVIT